MLEGVSLPEARECHELSCHHDEQQKHVETPELWLHSMWSKRLAAQLLVEVGSHAHGQAPAPSHMMPHTAPLATWAGTSSLSGRRPWLDVHTGNYDREDSSTLQNTRHHRIEPIPSDMTTCTVSILAAKHQWIRSSTRLGRFSPRQRLVHAMKDPPGIRRT